MNLTGWLLDFAIKVIETVGYWGVFFVLVLDNAGIPIPSEATLALAGSLSKTGTFNIVWIIILGTIAQTIGTYIAYLIGKYGGGPLVKKYGKYILISAHDYDKAEKWFEKRGDKAIFISRLIPVIRTFAGFAAGTFEMDQNKFIRDSLLGSLVWTTTFVLIGYVVGDSWKRYYSYLHYLDYVIIVVLAVLIGRYVYRKLKKRKTHAAQD